MLQLIHEEGYVYGNLCLDNIIAIRKKYNGIKFGRLTIQDVTLCYKQKLFTENKKATGSESTKKHTQSKQKFSYRLTAFSSTSQYVNQGKSHHLGSEITPLSDLEKR